MTLAPEVRLVLVHGANPAVIAYNDPARDDPPGAQKCWRPW